MKALKYILAVLSVIIVFIAGLWLFAPWEAVAVYALDSVRYNAANNGMYINYDNLSANGRLAPEFIVRNFNVETPFARIFVPEARAKLLPLKSIFSMGACSEIDFRSAEMTMLPKNQLEVRSGHLNMAIDGEVLNVSGVDFKGDLSVTGDASYNLTNKKVRSSTLLFEVPDNINSMLGNPMLGRYIESAENGKWRIKYEAQNK